MDRIGILFGGVSAEHDVSLMSATTVLRSIDRDKHEVVMIGITREGKFRHFTGEIEELEAGTWEQHSAPITVSDLPDMIDFAFPVMHGHYGEDGSVQGLLQILQIPWAGCGVMSSAVNLDKIASKQVFASAGLPVPAWVVTDRQEIDADPGAVLHRCEASLGACPWFVKPANTGSSIGITRVSRTEELEDALHAAAEIDRRVVIEQGIDCREVEVGVIGNDRPEVSGAGEIVSGHEFYDYGSKYRDDAGTQILIPADLTEDQLAALRDLARRAYQATDCSGFARVDMMIDRKTGGLYVNEINTIPGFTRYSMFPMLWKEEGISYTEQIDRIISLGYERFSAGFLPNTL